MEARGLSAAAAAALLVVVTALAAAFDMPDTVGQHRLFFVGFVATCAAVAVAAHRQDLLAVAFLPPLAFAAGVGVVAAVSGGSREGGLLARLAVNLVQPLVFGAPALLTGTALAVTLALLRGAARRRRP